ncbi:MAG: hypothetical protein IT196_10165 [Acidimicrobiales bacterium]|nr:hypothetical protein [Acidimicrobiales bacterium]
MNETQASAASPIPFIASFEQDRPAGELVGTGGAGGVDIEGVVGVDHGALRIKPLVQPGWGRSAVTWGPFEPQCGLAASLLVLNGHNASENQDPWPSLPRFVLQWTRGTQVDAVLHRLRAVRRYGGRDQLSRRLLAWWHSRKAVAAGTTHVENLAAGFFGAAAPRDRCAGGPSFVVRSTGPTNGELQAGQRMLTALVESVQNIPMHLVVVLREEGALYAAASLPGVDGFGAMPYLRPLLIDPTPVPAPLFAGVHQAVLGQVGWGVDTRVLDVRVARPASLTNWFTTAQVADRPEGPPAEGRQAEAGGRWQHRRLGPRRTVAVLDAPQPSGLVHLRFRLSQAEQLAGVALRVSDADGWIVTVSGTGVAAERWSGGEVVDRHHAALPTAVAREHSLQVCDDGRQLSVIVDGAVALPAFDAGGASGNAVGVRLPDEVQLAPLVAFEAHPAALTLPADLQPATPPIPVATATVYDDDFRVPRVPVLDGTPRPDGPGLLGHRPVAEGGPVWEHTIGNTAFLLDGDGAVVQPVPSPTGGAKGKLAALVRAEEHRNAYTLPWPDPTSADAIVTLVAPGSGPGQGQRGRGGLVFRQDADHQLIVNTWIDDEYGGTSVSSFLRIGGFEDVYDAVWTNVGRRITYGHPYDLRVAFDGETYAVFVNDEPVLYRRISDIVPSAPPLRIERLGIVSNWEFGDDTGTRFLRFRASAGTHRGAPDAACNGQP